MFNVHTLKLVTRVLLASLLMSYQVHIFAAKQNQILYVNARAPGGDGASWEKAFNNLEAALHATRLSGNASQIWIAAGVYKPSVAYGGGYSGAEPNLVTFNLPNNIALYGGFNGTEQSLSKRDPKKNLTILSGDLNGDDVTNPGNLTNKSDNAWHVLTADGVTNVMLDGLVVQGGYAAGPDAGQITPQPIGVIINSLNYAHNNGGGLLVRHGAKVVLNEMQFQYNASNNARATVVIPLGTAFLPIAGGGGAVSAMDQGTEVTINESTFTHNVAISFGGNGGALNALLGAAYTISDSTFANNWALRGAGAIHGRDAGDIRIASSTFQNNQVLGTQVRDESGGAIGITDTNLTVADSTFQGNLASASFGGGGAIFYHLLFDNGEAYSLKISNTTFIDNAASALGGGAVNIFGFSPNPASSAKISDSLFSGNVAGVGGAIAVDSIETALSDNKFTGNQAWTNGGAIFGSNLGGVINDSTVRQQLAISDSSIVDNSLIGVPANKFPPSAVFGLVGATFARVLGKPPVAVLEMQPGGGGIASGFGGNISVSNTELASNSALNGIGGAILVGGVTGFSGVGGISVVLEKAYVSIKESRCASNTDQTGTNNIAISAPPNIAIGPDGVQFVSDSSCR